jgi:DNA-binding IclR family transcriptional regulator
MAAPDTDEGNDADEDRGGGRHAITRAIDLLRSIAKDGAGGARLIDLARRTGVPHPTARRILKMLMAERMVVQSTATSRYRLGPLAHELGLATSYDDELARICEPHIRRLARLTEDTVYLMLRSGFDGVCIARAEGSYPIRTVMLRVGGRRPLGVGPAGLALLADMKDADIHDVLRAREGSLPDYNAPAAADLWTAIATTRANGYALTRDWAIPGITGLGMTLATSGQLQAAISVSAISERLDDSRVAQVVGLMGQEVRQIRLDGAFLTPR